MPQMKAKFLTLIVLVLFTGGIMADTTRIYAGHNATGSAFCAIEFRSPVRMYRGHNATGSAAYAIDGNIPEAMLVFLAEKLLD